MSYIILKIINLSVFYESTLSKPTATANGRHTHAVAAAAFESAACEGVDACD
jgi:hypothetical protein